MHIRGEVVHNTRDNLIVTFAANKLSNKEGFFGTSDPFLKIARSVVGGERTGAGKDCFPEHCCE